MEPDVPVPPPLAGLALEDDVPLPPTVAAGKDDTAVIEPLIPIPQASPAGVVTIVAPDGTYVVFEPDLVVVPTIVPLLAARCPQAYPDTAVLFSGT